MSFVNVNVADSGGKSSDELANTAKTISSAKKALSKGEISVAQYNSIMDSIYHPGRPSRAAQYDDIVSGKQSMLGALFDAAKQSPELSDIASTIDSIIGSDLSDYFSGSGSESGSGGRGGSGSESGSGGRGGSGSGLSSVSNSGYGSYLDMLHQEQERVWQREDTAYQRTVKDLQAAGLNPVLAVNHGVSASGGSSSSDSQVVGAVADLAAMAISGLTETARGAMQLSEMTNPSALQKFGSWYKSNSRTISTAVNTAASVARIIAKFA